DTERPVRGITGASKDTSLGVAENALPQRSTTHTYDVSRGTALGSARDATGRCLLAPCPDAPSYGSPADGISGHALPARTSARRPRAYSVEISRSMGTWTKRGSPYHRSRSAKASFKASTTRCT